MIIIGHEEIPFKPFYYVETVEEIENTPPGSVLWLGPFSKAKKIARHCYENRIGYAVMAESVKEALMANALHAGYIIVPAELAKKVQAVAETYLFDAKILLPISDEEEMESAAEIGLDGVIFKAGVVS